MKADLPVIAIYTTLLCALVLVTLFLGLCIHLYAIPKISAYLSRVDWSEFNIFVPRRPTDRPMPPGPAVSLNDLVATQNQPDSSIMVESSVDAPATINATSETAVTPIVRRGAIAPLAKAE